MADSLEQKIENEFKEIINAPKVNASYVIVGRCSFCGQPADDLEIIHSVVHQGRTIERKKCKRCRGGA